MKPKLHIEAAAKPKDPAKGPEKWPLVLALLCKTHSGKGLFVEYLREALSEFRPYFYHLRTAEILEQMCAKTCVPGGRVAYQKSFDCWEKAHGVGTFARMHRDIIKWHSSSDLVVFDCIRMPADLDMILSLPRYLIVHIAAHQRDRWKWGRSDAREGKGKPDEADMTESEFLKNERESPTENQIDFLIARASQEDNLLKITNFKSKASFKRRVGRFAAAQVVPRLAEIVP